MTRSSLRNAVNISSTLTINPFPSSVRVHNPDCSPFKVERRDPAQAKSGFAEIVGDDLPIFHAADFAYFVLRMATTK